MNPYQPPRPRHWVLLVLLALAGLYACRTPVAERPAPALSASALVGEWAITGIEVSPQQNGTTDALNLANTLNGNQCVNQLIIGFDPNNKLHLDYPQAPGCFQAKTDYLGYFTGLGGQQWSLDKDQLVISGRDQATSSVRYAVRLQGDQMIWRYQVQRDQQVDPNQTVFESSKSVPLTYTISLRNKWRP